MSRTTAVIAHRAFAPLDPWALPPERRLLKLAEPDFWDLHCLVPLRLETDGLMVVAGRAVGPRVVEALEASASQPVHLAIGAADEVSFWLDVLQGRRTWAEAMADGLADLLNQLGLRVVQETTLRIAARDALAVEDVAEAFGLTEEAAVETLALRARLPQIRLERYSSPSYLGALLPRAEAARLRVVPIVARRGRALLAGPQVLGRHDVERLGELVGLEVQLGVCAPSAFDRAFETIFAAPAEQTSALADGAVLEHLVAIGALDRSRRNALLRLGGVTAQSPLSGALRLGYVAPRDVQRARARGYGLEPIEPGRLRVDVELGRRGAPVLWQRWRCIPIERSGRTAVVACDGPLEIETRELVARLLQVADVALRYVLPDALDGAMRDLPEPRPESYSAEDHLRESGLLRPEQAADLERLANRTGVGIVEAHVAASANGPEDAVEARSIALGRAWVRLARYAPAPGVAELVPRDLARAEFGVALRRHGESLTFAMLNGHDNPTPGLLERTTGLAIDPILAVVVDPEQAFTRWYDHGDRVVPERYQAFGRFLVRRGFATRAQIGQAYDGLVLGRALDQLLVEPGLLSPDQLVVAFREHLAIDEVGLDPRPRPVERIDALGQQRLETIWEDPVDRGVARLLGGELARRHGAMPIAQSGGAVVVAFANPLDDEALAAVEAALDGPIRVVAATRRAIEVAQRRVYGSKSIGERLLQTGVITPDQLQRALQVHDRAGVRIGKALVNLGFVAEDELAMALAEQADLPFYDLASADPDRDVARLLPMDLERERGILPICDDGDAIVVACADLPEACGVDDAEARIGRRLQPVVVTESSFDAALDALYRDEYLEHSAAYLVSRSPEDSGKWVLSHGQKVFFLGLLLVTALGLALAPAWTMTIFFSLSTLFYVAFANYKFYLAYRGVTHQFEVETTAEELAAIDDRVLPVYTILVPVYREAEVFPILARAIGRLDYPKAKLDVQILLEEDDRETIEVARRSKLPSHFRLVVVPSGMPKGKPKACNYGLIHARGEYVVIFDAEDIPEPDQLKKAILAFRKGDADLACVQAKLNYFNRDQNLLTRWFTTEYSMWFDLFLPGLDASGAPIPLGGTSNHFKTDRLRELGAWDPHNVTEDADLGMRLFKAGWKTSVIDSTTYEEANSDVYNWIRQRSRWVKGYILTYLVHMRHPIALLRAIGPKAFLSFQLVIGGTFFGFLLNPILWALTALWFGGGAAWVEGLFPGPIFYLGAIGLYWGNFAFTYLNVAGCLRRGYYDLVKYALLSPIYWALMSIAAWKGFLQLFYAPSYWEKTNHGLANVRFPAMPDYGRPET